MPGRTAARCGACRRCVSADQGVTARGGTVGKGCRLDSVGSGSAAVRQSEGGDSSAVLRLKVIPAERRQVFRPEAVMDEHVLPAAADNAGW